MDFFFSSMVLCFKAMPYIIIEIKGIFQKDEETRQIVAAAFEALATFDAVDAPKLAPEAVLPNKTLILSRVGPGNSKADAICSRRSSSLQSQKGRLRKKAAEPWSLAPT